MAKPGSRLERIRSGIQALQDESLLRAEGQPSRLYKFLHFWVLVGKSFGRNRCPLRASALSYSTLLALIPMLAVAISVTSSILKKEGEQQIYQFIDRVISGIMPPAAVVDTNTPASSAELATNAASGVALTNPPLLTAAPVAAAGIELASTNSAAGTNTPALAGQTAAGGTNAAPASDHDVRVVAAQKEAAGKIHEFIQNTQSGAIAGVGMLALVYMAIRMLSQIEDTFNAIWGVTRGRNWFLRIWIYWGVISLGPLLLAGALGLASGPHLEATHRLIAHVPLLGSVVLPLSTLLILWLTFALLYMAVPNTKVHFSAALVGGIVGGSLWHLNNVFGFLYVSRVVTNSKIYGSLGLVPVFMAGVYLSWFILLFGAQVAYAYQNRKLYLQEKLAENVNQRGREFIAMRLITCIGQRFVHGLPPVTIRYMSEELGVPSRLIQQVLQTLVAAHLVIEISGAEPAYTPSRPLEQINAHHVLMAMRATPGQELVTRDEPVREEVYGEFARIQEAEKQVASSVSLITLVNRAQARLELAPAESAEDPIKLKPALVPPAGAAIAPAEPQVKPTATPDAGSGSVRIESEPQSEAKPPGDTPISEPTTDDDRKFPL